MTCYILSGTFNITVPIRTICGGRYFVYMVHTFRDVFVRTCENNHNSDYVAVLDALFSHQFCINILKICDWLINL